MFAGAGNNICKEISKAKKNNNHPTSPSILLLNIYHQAEGFEASFVSNLATGDNHSRVKRNQRPSKCTDGETKKRPNYHCFCGNGQWICIKQQDKNTEHVECKSGDVREVNCDDCFCGIDGTWVCANMPDCTDGRNAISEVQTNVRNSQDDEDLCSNGESKKKDCNDCFCEGGEWVCTKMRC